jgi:hypothetical protein
MPKRHATARLGIFPPQNAADLRRYQLHEGGAEPVNSVCGAADAVIAHGQQKIAAFFQDDIDPSGPSVGTSLRTRRKSTRRHASASI